MRISQTKLLPRSSLIHCSLLSLTLLLVIVQDQQVVKFVAGQSQQQGDEQQTNNNNKPTANHQAVASSAHIDNHRQSQPTRPGEDDEYLIGVGIADITGPSADINLVSVLSQLAEFAADFLFASSSPSRLSSSSSLPSSLSSSLAFSEPSSRSLNNIRSADRPFGACDIGRTSSQGQRISSLLPIVKRAPSKNINRISDDIYSGLADFAKSRHLNNAHLPQSKFIDKNMDLHPEFARILRTKATRVANSSSLINELNKANLAVRILQNVQQQKQNLERQATISIDDRPLMNLAYPSWRDLQNVKLQIKVNLNNLLTSFAPTQTNSIISLLRRWAMPNQIKMQAEYTYANLVVRL